MFAAENFSIFLFLACLKSNFGNLLLCREAHDCLCARRSLQCCAQVERQKKTAEACVSVLCGICLCKHFTPKTHKPPHYSKNIITSPSEKWDTHLDSIELLASCKHSDSESHPRLFSGPIGVRRLTGRSVEPRNGCALPILNLQFKRTMVQSGLLCQKSVCVCIVHGTALTDGGSKKLRHLHGSCALQEAYF